VFWFNNLKLTCGPTLLFANFCIQSLTKQSNLNLQQNNSSPATTEPKDQPQRKSSKKVSKGLIVAHSIQGEELD